MTQEKLAEKANLHPVYISQVERAVRAVTIDALMRIANRDMKLHSILFGGSGFPTKPCVSPQVFHGSMRLAGLGRVVNTARGVEPSWQCSKPGSLKPGAS